MTCSVGAWKLLLPESRSRPPRDEPPRGARQPGRPAPGPEPGPVRPLLASPRFLAASSAQLDESFSDLTAFLSPGLAPGAAGAPGTALALWIVPLMPAAGSAGFGSSGFLATSTFLGADIIARIAAASASAAL